MTISTRYVRAPIGTRATIALGSISGAFPANWLKKLATCSLHKYRSSTPLECAEAVTKTVDSAEQPGELQNMLGISGILAILAALRYVAFSLKVVGLTTQAVGIVATAEYLGTGKGAADR